MDVVTPAPSVMSEPILRDEEPFILIQAPCGLGWLPVPRDFLGGEPREWYQPIEDEL